MYQKIDKDKKKESIDALKTKYGVTGEKWYTIANGNISRDKELTATCVI